MKETAEIFVVFLRLCCFTMAILILADVSLYFQGGGDSASQFEVGGDYEND